MRWDNRGGLIIGMAHDMESQLTGMSCIWCAIYYYIYATLQNMNCIWMTVCFSNKILSKIDCMWKLQWVIYGVFNTIIYASILGKATSSKNRLQCIKLQCQPNQQ